MKNIKNKAFTLIELLVAISILIIIIAITIPNFSNFKKQQVLKNTTEDIVSLLDEARNNTISSKDSNAFGVHFQTDSAILFIGQSYTVDSVYNKEINFDSSVIIPNTGGINLVGGGSNVVFSKITGNVVNNGTIVIQLVSDNTKQKTISISPVGVISVN